MHVCPVCGFDHLRDPPKDFTICPCCGTEFEFDDAFAPYAALRDAWIRNGARWWSRLDLPPENWNPYIQLNNLLSSIPDTSKNAWVIKLLTFALSPYERFAEGGKQGFVTAQSSPSIPEMIKKAPRQSGTAAHPQKSLPIGVAMTNVGLTP
jgi:hypothetical protein